MNIVTFSKSPNTGCFDRLEEFKDALKPFIGKWVWFRPNNDLGSFKRAVLIFCDGDTVSLLSNMPPEDDHICIIPDTISEWVYPMDEISIALP